MGLCIFCCWYFGHIYSSPIIALFIVSASSMLLQLHFYLQNPLQNYFMFFLLILDLKTLKRGENFSGCFVGWWTWDKVIFWIFEYCTFATNIQIHIQIAQIQLENRKGIVGFVVLCNIPRLSERGWCRGAKRSHSLMDFFCPFYLPTLFPGARLTLRDH